jgi:hypothetical protein
MKPEKRRGAGIAILRYVTVAQMTKAVETGQIDPGQVQVSNADIRSHRQAFPSLCDHIYACA